MSQFFILLCTNLIILALLFFLLKNRIDRAVQPDNLLRNVRTEVQRMIVEINQTADGSIGIIEDRMKALDELLARADKRINLYKRELDRQELGSQTYSNILKKAPPPVREVGTDAPQPPPPKRPLREEVLDLHRGGLPADQISRKLGIPAGEVDLIISLAGNGELPR